MLPTQRLPRRLRPRNKSRGNQPRNLEIIKAPRARPELKYTDADVHQGDVINTGLFTLLNGIGFGTEAYQRVGRQIQLVNLDLRFAVTQQNGAVNTQICRVMVVYDRQTNGLIYPSSDLLDNSVALLFWTQKQYNRDGRQRFIVLHDECMQVNPNLLEGSFPFINRKIDLRGLATQYNAQPGLLVNTIMTGSLYLIAFSMAPLGAINLKADFAARVNYLDA